MDDNRKLLEEIRDLMKRQVELAVQEAERTKRVDEERTAQFKTSIDLATAQSRLYMRVVAAGAVVIVVMLILLFNLPPR